MPELACGLAGLAFGTILAITLSARPAPLPGTYLAVFPPLWSGERILGAIIKANAIPVASTTWGAWVIHLPPGGRLPHALTTNSETLLALTGACTTADGRR